MALYPTPHIKATPEDFAKTVLMPGDPLRSEFIAENYLENARAVNNVRGVQGYTGTYKGEPVSVMASGMGIPSICIYAYELYNIFGVENIIRIGSAGAMSEKLKLLDIVIAMGACTDSNFVHQYHLPGNFSAVCDYSLLQNCTKAADALGIQYSVGNILSSDIFYNDEENLPDNFKSLEAYKKMGVLAVEMEAAGLYMTAARSGKKALTLCTVSNSLITGESTSSEDRRIKLTQMIEIALNTAVSLSKNQN